MTINIDKNLFMYFGSETKLTVCVNRVADYVDISRIKRILPQISFSDENTVLVQIDESELADESLEDRKMFVLLAVYAMGVGE